MSNTPSDADIVALAISEGIKLRTGAGVVRLARAVLAKWGTSQPVAREPLTNAHIRAMLNKHPPEDVCDWSYRMGIDDAELHHGIKGGQHGTDK